MRILIIEDDRYIADVFQQSLTGEGYAVDSAYSGDEGETMAESIPYDLILLDVVLPGRHGFEICRNLRAKNIDTPILMISGKMKDDPDVIRGLDCGADDYLIKPVRSNILSAKIGALIRRHHNVKNTQIQVGDIRHQYCPSPGMAGRERNYINPKKNMPFLIYLVYHPQMTISRNELELHTSNRDQAIGSNVVDVHIMNLRHKLGDKISIETVKGLGYRLNIAAFMFLFFLFCSIATMFIPDLAEFV